MQVGDRVRAGRFSGTIIEPTPEIIAKRPALARNPHGLLCVQFDDFGPHGDGIGVYAVGSWQLLPARPSRVSSAPLGNA